MRWCVVWKLVNCPAILSLPNGSCCWCVEICLALDVSTNGALARRRTLQGRIHDAAHGILHRTGRNASAERLFIEIRSYLLKASDARLIVDSQNHIRSTLAWCELSPRPD